MININRLCIRGLRPDNCGQRGGRNKRYGTLQSGHAQGIAQGSGCEQCGGRNKHYEKLQRGHSQGIARGSSFVAISSEDMRLPVCRWYLGMPGLCGGMPNAPAVGSGAPLKAAAYTLQAAEP